MPVLRFHKAEVRRGESANIREDRTKIRRIDAEPGGDGREVLINRGGRNPAASARVVGAINCERRKFSVGLAADDGAAGGIEISGAAENQMMAAPAVIAPLPVARERAAEIAGGERRDAVLQSQLLHRLLEHHQRLAQFREQIRVRANDDVAWVVRIVAGLAAMQIVAADLAKENLALHAESVARAASGARTGFDEPRDHF